MKSTSYLIKAHSTMARLKLSWWADFSAWSRSSLSLWELFLLSSLVYGYTGVYSRYQSISPPKVEAGTGTTDETSGYRELLILSRLTLRKSRSRLYLRSSVAGEHGKAGSIVTHTCVMRRWNFPWFPELD